MHSDISDINPYILTLYTRIAVLATPHMMNIPGTAIAERPKLAVCRADSALGLLFAHGRFQRPLLQDRCRTHPACAAQGRFDSGSREKARVERRLDAYDASAIEVLEGLEPVRRRPGMYIGGTDEKALHHLFAEVIDNSMDEAVAGHATFIEVELGADGFLTVTDNGRGIPVDPHPKFKNKSALEVIMTTLHAGGKFDQGLRDLAVCMASACR
jgi:hypothetical protein